MKKTQTRIITIFILLFTVVCAVAFWLTADFLTERIAQTEIKDGWYYFDADGTKQSASLPCSITAGTTLELYHEEDNIVEFAAGRVIATNAAVYDVELYWNDELLYQFIDGGREVNTPVRSNIVCMGTIPAVKQDNMLRIVYHSASGFYNLPAVSISTEKDLVFSVLSDYTWGLLMSFSMMIVGFFALFLGGILCFQKQNGNRILCLAWFLILCGLWCAADSPFTFLLFAYDNLVFYLDFYFFMLMPIPLFYFVLNSGDMRKHKWLAATGYSYYLNIALQSIFASKGVFTFFKMLFVSHALMVVVGVLIPLCMLLREYRRKKQHEILLCLQALSAVGIIGAIAILLYVFFNYAAYQLVFQTGLLLLMIVLLSSLLKEFVESVKNRTEAMIYKQLSEQDKLTKLENRRAFDLLLEKIESGALQYQNAAMLFMDVNFLKSTNDAFGHDAGDQLILQAAVCIQNAFGAAGYCYRVGGDEFCAVLLDPSNTAEELQMRLDVEQQKINHQDSTKHRLSLACGCCFKVEDGASKTISQWKATADERMYQNKRRIKEKMYQIK